ncbi:MAG: ABC-type polysaccharide/polyol phosphate transport system, ATPase component [Chthonomonadaceae bacterium]|nr:ABC-type polysaccharide/polyol phosphate transport system, ATPase component [Chthonomonadaceae bacterium]
MPPEQPLADSELPAIEIINLVKQFRILHTGSIKGALSRLLKPQRVEEFTALKDISFTVPHGQTLAIIGRNGSGKSTMLGILARVYRATSGTVRLNGPGGRPARIAPLLELGAGFQPDLTGYQNVQFYGAVLGMNGRQIRDRMDSIEEFAELKDKMDTQMHGWNDGAKLRLGFSIAIHIDPDILLVDEVLAVGDESFQNKCYRKIAELQEHGKTIVFVSHDLPVVERVANRVLWLNNGIIMQDGDPATVLTAYRATSAE